MTSGPVGGSTSVDWNLLPIQMVKEVAKFLDVKDDSQLAVISLLFKTSLDTPAFWRKVAKRYNIELAKGSSSEDSKALSSAETKEIAAQIISPKDQVVAQVQKDNEILRRFFPSVEIKQNIFEQLIAFQKYLSENPKAANTRIKQFLKGAQKFFESKGLSQNFPKFLQDTLQAFVHAEFQPEREIWEKRFFSVADLSLLGSFIDLFKLSHERPIKKKSSEVELKESASELGEAEEETGFGIPTMVFLEEAPVALALFDLMISNIKGTVIPEYFHRENPDNPNPTHEDIANFYNSDKGKDAMAQLMERIQLFRAKGAKVVFSDEILSMMIKVYGNVTSLEVINVMILEMILEGSRKSSKLPDILDYAIKHNEQAIVTALIKYVKPTVAQLEMADKLGNDAIRKLLHSA